METILSELIPYISKWTDKAKADASVKGVVFKIECRSEYVYIAAESGLELERVAHKYHYVYLNQIGYEDLSEDEMEPFAGALRDEMLQRCKAMDPRISIYPAEDDPNVDFYVDLSAIRPAWLKKI